jgi:hypothetical protein
MLCTVWCVDASKRAQPYYHCYFSQPYYRCNSLTIAWALLPHSLMLAGYSVVSVVSSVAVSLMKLFRASNSRAPKQQQGIDIKASA